MTTECRSRRAFTDVLWKQIEPPRRATAKAGGAAASPLIEAAYAAAVQQIADWKSSLNLELRDLEQEVTSRAAEIDRQIREGEGSAQRALMEFGKLCSSLQGSAVRRRLNEAFVTGISSQAIAALRRNPLYPPLPGEVRTAARQTVRAAVRAAIQAPFVGPILEAIGCLDASPEARLQDVWALNPNRPLGEQILELVLDAVEDELAGRFGGADPRVEIAVDLRFEFFGPQRIQFALGSLSLPLRPYFNLLRAALRGIPDIRDRMESTAREWSAWTA